MDVRLALQQTMIEDLRSQEQRLEQSVEARTRALADAADRDRAVAVAEQRELHRALAMQGRGLLPALRRWIGF